MSRNLLTFAASLKTKLGYKFYILIVIIAYVIIYSSIEIAIYRSFKHFTWDLGIFNQALWNTVHGKLLYYTVEPYYTRTGCFLGAHFSPIILLALPFYLISMNGENLLVISTIVVAIGAFPAYELANYFFKNEKVATIAGILYLFYPTLQGVTLSGFSPESFQVTCFLFILLYLVKNDFRKLSISTALGLLTHEASAPVIAFIGIYGCKKNPKTIKNKGFLVSLIIVVASILYFPFAYEMRRFFGWTGAPSLWQEWSLMGAKSPEEILIKVFLNPIGAITSLTSDWMAKMLYLILLLFPYLFLPILGWEGLIPAIPYMSISLLSTYRLYYTIEGHYGAFTAPFLYLGFLYGIDKIRKKHAKISVLKLTEISFLITLTISLLILLPFASIQYKTFDVDEEHNSLVRDFILKIPQNASILTQSNIFPHISNRLNAYTIAPPTWGSNYVEFNKEILTSLSTANIEYVLLDFASKLPYSSSAYFIYIHFIIPNKHRYTLCYAEDGILLFHLNHTYN